MSFEKLDFLFQTYQSPCCPKKPDGFSNTMQMRMSGLKINLYMELIMRFREYFQEQFVDGMVYTDPYSDPKKDFVESQQRRTMNELTE
jgi:hypothetical protein